MQNNQNQFKTILLSLLLIFGIISCKTPENQIDKLNIAKKYYNALNNSRGSEMKELLSDSLVYYIPDYDYKQTFYREKYLEDWLKWDSVFDPTYKILQIEESNGMVNATISKIDKRIFFLQQKPFITHETLKFKNDKIIAKETKYINFNENLWEKNKTELLDWIANNYPELNGFINDQTETGGLKYSKAIELYNNR